MQPPVPPLADAYALAASERLPEALPIIKAHAEAGNAEALFTLGDLHWRGFGVERDHLRAFELFKQSSDGGFPMAVRNYINLLANGATGTLDWGAALTSALRRSAFRSPPGVDVQPDLQDEPDLFRQT